MKREHEIEKETVKGVKKGNVKDNEEQIEDIKEGRQTDKETEVFGKDLERKEKKTETEGEEDLQKIGSKKAELEENSKTGNGKQNENVKGVIEKSKKKRQGWFVKTI